jgi:hypothetical protein
MPFRRSAVLVPLAAAIAAGPLMATPAFASGSDRGLTTVARVTAARAVPVVNCRAIRWLPKSFAFRCR